MNKAIYKLACMTVLAISCSLFLSMSGSANEKDIKLTLVGEDYRNSALVREYRDAANNEHIDSFLVPEHLEANVDNAENKVREAKKVLLLYYTYKDDAQAVERLKNNIFYEDGHILSVSADYASTFNSDLATNLEFVANNLANTAVKEKYLSKEPDETLSDDMHGGHTDPTETEEMKESVSKPVDEKAPIITNDKSFDILYIIIPFVLFVIGGIVFYIFSRR